MGPVQVRVRGGASAEELAAVLAVLSTRDELPAPYEQWRRARLAALRRAPRGGTIAM